MLRVYIIPFLKKKMDTSKEITATLEGYDISKIDQAYVKNKVTKQVNKALVDKVLNNEPLTPQDQQKMTSQATGMIQEAQSSLGNIRYFSPDDVKDVTWKEAFKDLEWDIEVDITGENTPDKDDLMTLNTVLQTIATNPRVLSDPNAKLIFNKILGIAGGVSPLELTDTAPYVPLPARRFTETMDYADVPDDVKRQMEAQEGFQPSTMPSPAPQGPSVPTPGSVPSPMKPSPVPQKVP